MRKEKYDIKAPDGFLLGGLRRVRKGGIILFQRGWWQAPEEWAGQLIWVHCSDSGAGDLEAAPPGLHIYTARAERNTVWCKRTKRRDARPQFRRPDHKRWAERARSA